MASIMEHFSSLPDPRRDHRKEHKLIDILFITIAAVICGADDWYEIEEYGKYKKPWLQTILELPNGIPSHDTFNRVFSILDTAAFQQCFINWVQSISSITDGQLISIDGKRLCNSGEHGNKAVIHLVSAWSNANGMVLGQVKVNDKSNEITAIPALLDLLIVKGSWITIDAMGCQKDIAVKIKEKEAEYILAVKDNQEHLHDDIQEAFEQGKITDEHSQYNMGHGRIEKRTCRILTDTDWVCNREDWKSLNTLIEISTERTIKATGIKESQTRHYISSINADAKQFNEAIRGHWGIENKLHWTLDMVFGEDNSTKRAGTAAENFSFISKVALNLLNQYKYNSGAKAASVKLKRKRAGWDNEFLLAILANTG